MNGKKTDQKNRADADLFRQSVAGTHPLKQKNSASHPPHRAQSSPHIRQHPQDASPSLQDRLSDEGEVEDVTSSDELRFARPGLQHSVIKKLRRGQYNIDAELDMHGMVVSEARAALLAFLHACKTDNARCVRIVHGKGHGSSNRRPVLKNSLNHWLKQIDEVLVFCSALPKDGGTGAVYLLLKRSKR